MTILQGRFKTRLEKCRFDVVVIQGDVGKQRSSADMNYYVSCSRKCGCGDDYGVARSDVQTQKRQMKSGRTTTYRNGVSDSQIVRYGLFELFHLLALAQPS